MTMLQHSFPMVFSDHLSPLFRECFPRLENCTEKHLDQNRNDSQHECRVGETAMDGSIHIGKCVLFMLIN